MKAEVQRAAYAPAVPANFDLHECRVLGIEIDMEVRSDIPQDFVIIWRGRARR